MELEPLTPVECSQKLSAIDDALYVIGGKWKLRVLIALREGCMRFNEIQREVDGISARVLSNELKELEINGFLNRKVHDTTPVMVEYKLTDYAQTLYGVMKALSDWGKLHRDKIRGQ